MLEFLVCSKAQVINLEDRRLGLTTGTDFGEKKLQSVASMDLASMVLACSNDDSSKFKQASGAGM